MSTSSSHWHIFCKVIDNYGDIGVCWRLACDLAARGKRVCLWLDAASALAWMAPGGCPGVSVRAWTPELPLDALLVASATTSNTPVKTVLLEAFGCEVNPELIAKYRDSTRANAQKFVWINLEYLSAENYVEKCHGLPSPVMSGPAAGMTKHFFYPGFTRLTGGLIREPDLLQRQSKFDRTSWLKTQGISWSGERLVSLFCYEPEALGALLAQLANGPMPVKLLVTHGRARRAVEAWMAGRTGRASLPMIRGQLSFCYLPALTQIQYDELLWACDLNFVRGEDSLARACLSGKPFVWQIYPQGDDAHHAKLQAFLDMLGAPDSLRQMHLAWNGLPGLHADASQSKPAAQTFPALSVQTLAAWLHTAAALRNSLLSQTDLSTQLIAFADQTGQKNR